MEKTELYSVSFKTLKEGRHNFSFDINDDFLKHYSISNVKGLCIGANIKLHKSDHFIRAEFNLSGTINIRCGRCLEYFDLPVSHESELTAEFADYNSDLSEADKHILIDEGEGKLKLDQHFYDFIVLSIPYKPVHPEVNGEYTCNPEMIENLEKHSGTNDDKIDPRWDKLKNVFNK
ncbi:MAG: DUF177 domain-containing protein [Bacteroidota bacterium]|nr:DUF177 domain-containing protein [Bacteroidota bacterium]